MPAVESFEAVITLVYLIIVSVSAVSYINVYSRAHMYIVEFTRIQ